MAQEFEGDLAGARFWGADLRQARFRYVDLSGAEISHAVLVGVEVDAFVDRLVVNGVDVTAFVAERDRWHPLRSVLVASDPAAVRAGAAALHEAWSTTTERARRLPDRALHESVDGEWSFVQTLRHLVLATDKWFEVPVLHGRFHPFGLPDTGSAGLPWPGVDLDASPSLDDVLAARAEQARRLAEHLDTVTDDDLARTVDVPLAGPHPVRECVATVLEEDFWHLRYADRDLTALETRP